MPAWLAALAGLIIPALFWLFHALGWPLWLVGVVLLPFAWRRRALLPGLSWLAPAAAVFGVLALLLRSDLPVRLYPVLVNLAMLIVFALSLKAPQTMIERIARLTEPDLPESGVRYTRRVTVAWCVFFAANGLIALATALYGDARVWSIYNGLIAYGLIGLMLGGEWLIRQRVRRHG
ncbi:hypothetical protein [Silvimonas iriomotensis]|uniref:DNA gyrase subunit B n=1 Tax=Silvimonas iriomotensis TaxID=449662 RepID=A0ABQ2P9Q0_9NEIS|nr:hypothetical protein [Silvimonas iriomotensis]GGP21754.1 hypothetical protein GCM10010970_22050 [Silvimonas iriomotensis]